MADERWLSSSETAFYLGVKHSQVHKWVHVRKIPSDIVVGLHEFKVSEEDKWVESGKAGHVQEEPRSRCIQLITHDGT